MAATTTRSRAKATPAAEPKTEKKETLHQIKNRLRSEAEREVLQLHKDEVISRTQAKFDAAGLEYVRRLTPEEKAQKEIEESLNQFPGLREKFMSELARNLLTSRGEHVDPPEGEGPDYNEIPDEDAYYREAQIDPSDLPDSTRA